MQRSDRWGPMMGGVAAMENGGGNPSARLRAVRSMPQWVETRGVGLPSPPPPPPEPEPNVTDPDYEVIDIPTNNYSNTPPTTIEVRVKRCELCGASGPSVLCEQCPQQSFCPSCDEMYHRHPKRQSHIRRAIIGAPRIGETPRPPLPPKGEGLSTPAPVPPPRRNKKNQLFPGSTGSLKRETGIVGSIKRIISGGKSPQPTPVKPPLLSRDRSASLLNNNIDFTRNQMMMPDMDATNWSRGSRVGSMNALNMSPQFGPMMHAQSMAHVGCPSCWGWGSQAALHQAGMHGHPGPMMPPQPFWYPSWDPRKQRRHHHSRTAVNSSSEEEHPSPAMSRRSMMRDVDSDSDESFHKSRPQSRRESFSDLRRRDDDTMSLRGGGRYDDDTRSLRGYRRDSFRRREEVMSEREGRRTRRFDDTMSERGGVSRRHEDSVMTDRSSGRRRRDETSPRRRDDDTFSEKGDRRLSETKYREEDWDRGSKRNDKKYQRDVPWDKHADKSKDRYVPDSDSDRILPADRKDRSQNNLKVKEDRKTIPSPAKSSETLSSVMSSTSGEERVKVSKRDRVFSDTGQSRRSTLNKPELKPKEPVIEAVKKEENNEVEDELKPLDSIPVTEWECRHCTYVNRPGIRVCEVCCKTKTAGGESPPPEESVDLELTTDQAVDVKEEVQVEKKLQTIKLQESPPRDVREVVQQEVRLPEIIPPEIKPQEKKKEDQIQREATVSVVQATKSVSLSSKGTSPPPQSISTQTYEVAGSNVKKTSPEVGWSSPRRSFSRQSIISDTAQSGMSPPRSRSPETDSQATETRQLRRMELNSTLTRKPSRASSLANEHNNTMVQKQVNQGLEMVKLLRDAEEAGFSGEEVSVAVEHCGDSSPLQWLLENWAHMIDTVVTLATNYGHERKENTIGTVSEREARSALLTHQGSVWSAVTEVVQQRQNKYGELLSRGNFSREDIVTALTAHRGELEAAYTELTKEEKEEIRLELDPSGRVQNWLTQHVYRSLPKLKTPAVKQPTFSRRHSDVHRFLDEVLSAQTSPQPSNNDRYGSLHSLATNSVRNRNEPFGAPPERYTSCLDLHEASTRLDLTTPRLYAKQHGLTLSRAVGSERNITQRQISVPDHLLEYKEKILFDRQESAPGYLYKGVVQDIQDLDSRTSRWKQPDIETDLAEILQDDSKTDDYVDSKSEDILKEEEDVEEARDQVYNGRLQLLLQKNHRRRRRPRRGMRNYHNKVFVKNDIKSSRTLRDELSAKIESLVADKRDKSVDSVDKGRIKESTDEYESGDSSEEEFLKENAAVQQSVQVLKRPAKNERIIKIEREISDNEQKHDENFEIIEEDRESNNSDRESINKSQSDDLIETDYREPEGSFGNSIPFIDEDDNEVFSEASEDVLEKPESPQEKGRKSRGGNRSDDSSKYQTAPDTSEKEVKAQIKTNQTPNTVQAVKNKNSFISPDEQVQKTVNLTTDNDSLSTVVTKKSSGQDNDQVKENIQTIEEQNEEDEEVSEEEEYEYVEFDQTEDVQSSDFIIDENIKEINAPIIIQVDMKPTEDKITVNEATAKEQNEMVHQNDKKHDPSVTDSKQSKVQTPEEFQTKKSNATIENSKQQITKPLVNMSQNEQTMEQASKEVQNKKSDIAESKTNEQIVEICLEERLISNVKEVDPPKILTSEGKEPKETIAESNKETQMNNQLKDEQKSKEQTKTEGALNKPENKTAKSNSRKENALNHLTGVLQLKMQSSAEALNKKSNVSLKTEQVPKVMETKEITPVNENTKVVDKSTAPKKKKIASKGIKSPDQSESSSSSVNKNIDTSNKSKKDQEINVVEIKETKGNTENNNSNKENIITVQITQDTEITPLDDTKHDKLELVKNSDGTVSEDNSRLTAFTSGQLKTKVKMENQRLSPVIDVDESSDKDVSPIPTDSEGDKSRGINQSVNFEEDIMTKNKREEMVTLIKESLSKDVVLDRLVGTILGVLQGGGSAGLKEEDIAAAILKEEAKVAEMPVGVDEGVVTAIQMVKDFSVNPKEALQGAILHDTIKISSDVVKDDFQIKKEEYQREVRKVLAEGLVTSYPQAEMVVSLMELKFTAEEAVQAAVECTSLSAAISFLHQECPLCANKCTIKEMVGMLECDHRCCKDCAFNYFNLQVTEGSVWDCVCPFCRLPNLKFSSQDQAQLYFSHLDILLKGLLSEAAHELFQRKLRDWTLAQDPNFKWCTKCSSGFIANPDQKVLMCPDCRSITCARCRKPWEGDHAATCEQLAEQAEPENLLNKHLEEEGITCPSCKARYTLARGGCMHMTCTGCKHEFCSGCCKPFLMGDRCQVSEYCIKLGLHAHHPRNCLFYLRDKEPQVLEQLLKENNVDFRREDTDEESSTGRCKVNIVKETDDGLIESECGHPIHAQALCRSHYVEHLVKLVKRRRLDPAQVMDLTEAQQELRRRGKHLPDRLPRQCDSSYLQALIKMVQEQIPLE